MVMLRTNLHTYSKIQAVDFMESLDVVDSSLDCIRCIARPLLTDQYPQIALILLSEEGRCCSVDRS